MKIHEQAQEPVAVVGMACRYPGGVDSPEALWRAVIEGRHVAIPFPADRSLTEIAEMAPPELLQQFAPLGGFIDNPGLFDPEFFGISPREARAMDPQQRLLLEVCWEAIERAGIDAKTLRGSQTGVFAGAMAGDYGYLIPGQKDVDPGYVATGISQSVLSGRISYLFGFEGPTMTVDTACSSSLVAIHLACQSLRSGETTLALAGGVSVMSTLTGFFALGQHGAISKEGKCKAYGADADGFCMSEGAGVLVLERLSAAQRNGHPVLAVFRGTAVNQDGLTKGMTVPSCPAQQKLIRTALADAGLSAADVDVVEGHGTGTPVGDPIELEALLNTYGLDRPGDRPLRLGSVKSNFGHTQAAAGAAGVIKIVEALRHKVLPATLHVSEPTPSVDWSVGNIELVTETAPWPPNNGHPRRAGVSAFGISGTNAHVILEEAPALEDSRPPTDSAPPIVPLSISAKTADAVRGQAAKLLAHLESHPDLEPVDVGYTLATGRTCFEHRAVVLGHDRDELLSGLAALAGDEPLGAIRGHANYDHNVVFVFPGQGAQWKGMAVDLMEESTVFADQIRACEEAFAEFVDWSLIDVLHGRAGAPSLERVDVVQPANFAVMVSVATLWRSMGVEPAAVIGHSQGEIAAAYIAGALSLRDAARIVTLRSLALVPLAGKGSMASITAPPELIQEHLEQFDGLCVAALNGPGITVVSGDADELKEFSELCKADGIRLGGALEADVAGHSPQMEAIREPLAEALTPIAPQSTDVVFFSTVTGDALDTATLDGDYWYRNLREPVNFQAAMLAAYQSGYCGFIEMSAHPVLTVAMLESMEGAGARSEDFALISSLRRHAGGMERFMTSLAEAHVRGASPNWAKVFPASAQRVDLPTYAFQLSKFWFDGVAAIGGKPSSLGLAPADHPLLGAMTDLPGSDRFQFTGRLSRSTHGWIVDHALFGNVLVPGAMLLELALHVGDRLGCPRVEKLTMFTPITLPESDGLQLSIVVGERKPSGKRSVAIYARVEPADDAGAERGPWGLHADGILAPPELTHVSDVGGLEVWPPAGAEVAMDVAAAYQGMAALGYQYGATFQGMKAVWRRGEEVFVEVALPDTVTDAGEFGIHPALLDASLQASAAIGSLAPSESGSIPLPFSWENVSLNAVGASTLRVRLVASGQDRVRWILADGSGRVVANGALLVRSISIEKLAQRGLSGPRESLYEVDWSPTQVTPARHSSQPGQWVIVGSELPRADVAVHADMASLLTSIDPSAEVPAVVVLSRFGGAGAGEGDALPRAVRDSVAQVLADVQAWLADDRLNSSKMIVLVRGAVAVAGAEDCSDLAGSATWGLLRSASMENPDRIVLLDADRAEVTLDVLATALKAGEPELALRGGVFHARRIRPLAEMAMTSAKHIAGRWKLDFLQSGNLDDLTLVEDENESQPLEPGTVRVALRAAGLTFRDVVDGLGISRARADHVWHEGAGLVLDVAGDVTEFAPGDRVLGLFETIGSCVITDRRLIATVPAELTFTQAAALPLAYLTAYHALCNVAAVQSGESLLVHCATGGVGTAAVALGRHFGMDVYATASPSKRSSLLDNGFSDDRIANSRSAEFEPLFAAANSGGMEVVLNLLPAEFVDPTLRLLAANGRFVEIARADVRDPAEVRRRYPNVQYSTFEIDELDVELLGRMLQEIMDLVVAGILPKLPVNNFDVRRAGAALRWLGHASHIGKVVLSWPPTFDPQTTVLLTGATGKIGSLIARHLVEAHGARHVVLASRSGATAEGAAELAAELSETGAQITIAACDVTDRQALARLIDEIAPEHPLGAVVHIAATLRDSTFPALTPEHLDAVLPAKVDGAWNLHELTAHRDLSAFVVFSSGAGTFGAPGQANYAAANVFLDALAVHRANHGLPATSIAWGWWAEETVHTGQLAEKDRARIRQLGVTPMETADALALFDMALTLGYQNVAAVGMDLKLLRAAASVAELPPLFRALVHTRPKVSGQLTDPSQLAKRLAGLSNEQQLDVVLELVKVPAAMVLGYSSPNDVDTDREFLEMGVDSLSSIELGAHLKALTGVQLSNSVIFEFSTPKLLAQHILSQVTPQETELAGPIVAEVEMLLERLAKIHPENTVPDDMIVRLSNAIQTLASNGSSETAATTAGHTAQAVASV